MAKNKLIGRNRPTARRQVRCYFCGQMLDVSAKTLSTTCPGCHKAIKVEDVVIKSYLPVNDVQTCGLITVTKRGRIAAKRVQSGDGVVCEGSIEGKVETPGPVQLGPKSSWKGASLTSKTLEVDDGAKLNGLVTVPCEEPEESAIDEKHAKLVRRVEPPNPTASLVKDDLEQPESRPKSAQLTETKPTPKPTVKSTATSKPSATVAKKKKTTSKKKVTKAAAVTADSEAVTARPAMKVIRTRAVRPATEPTAKATVNNPAPSAAAKKTAKKTATKKKKTTKKTSARSSKKPSKDTDA